MGTTTTTMRWCSRVSWPVLPFHKFVVVRFKQALHTTGFLSSLFPLFSSCVTDHILIVLTAHLDLLPILRSYTSPTLHTRHNGYGVSQMVWCSEGCGAFVKHQRSEVRIHCRLYSFHLTFHLTYICFYCSIYRTYPDSSTRSSSLQPSDTFPLLLPCGSGSFIR